MSVVARDRDRCSIRRLRVRRGWRTATFAAGALLVGLLPSVGMPAVAQEVGDVTVVPIQVTGPASERLNLVILCDGYQADEMQKCRDRRGQEPERPVVDRAFPQLPQLLQRLPRRDRLSGLRRPL